MNATDTVRTPALTITDTLRLTVMFTFIAGALVTVAVSLAAIAIPVLWPAAALVAVATPAAAVAAAHRAMLAYETA